MEDFVLKVNESLRRSETLSFGVNCTVKYLGRVESYLDKGDRLVIIKPDGTLIVHQPTGNAPVNYMKEGTTHTLERSKGGLCLKSENLSRKEFMEIMIHKVRFIGGSQLLDDERIVVSGSEKDMSDMIYETPELIEAGFKPLSREEHTKFGFIDVFGHDKVNRLVIVECKRQLADFKAVEQLSRYVERMKRTKGLKDGKVRGIIAAPAISSNAKDLLMEMGFEFKAVTPPKYYEKFDKRQARLDAF
ncbi:MAG: endonuclease NucS [archaeon]